MTIFNINKHNKLEQIKDFPFKLEKEIQSLSEKNINVIFGLEFVKSEFALNGFRIDTLAFDKESSSFVIIEYKRDKNFSVIDQGYAYLSLMLNNKSDFILEYNENCKTTLKREDIDWSQSRVIFVSPKFTTFQKEAINFKDLPIELWEIKRFSNATIIYNQIQTPKSQESIKTISRQNNTIDNVTKEIKVYTEQEHLEKTSIEIRELYETLKNAILALDNIAVKPKKFYIAFVENSNIVDIQIQKNSLKLWINNPKGKLEDSKNLTRDVSNLGHQGNGDYEIQITDDEHLEYILYLIKQCLRK